MINVKNTTKPNQGSHYQQLVIVCVHVTMRAGVEKDDSLRCRGSYLPLCLRQDLLFFCILPGASERRELQCLPPVSLWERWDCRILPFIGF